MRALQLLLISLLFFITTSTAHALTGIPKAFNLAGNKLVLNGAGTRTKFIVSVYNAGLYLKAKNSNAQQIIQANEPMAIRMRVVSGFATAEKMKQALNTGFKNSTGGKTAPIQPQITQLLNTAFSSKVSKGDVYDLAYTPNAGTQLIKNNKPITVIQGLPFKQALFGIWLSNRPAQASLKSELLGQEL